MKANAHLSVHNQNGKEAELKEEIVMKQPMLETANGTSEGFVFVSVMW